MSLTDACEKCGKRKKHPALGNYGWREKDMCYCEQDKNKFHSQVQYITEYMNERGMTFEVDTGRNVLIRSAKGDGCYVLEDIG